MTGKKKGKMKFKSAEQKRDYDRLAVEWKDLLKRQGATIEEKKRSRAMSAPLLTVGPIAPPGRETRKIPSLNTGDAIAALKVAPVYTGENMLGIGQMHKSNAVPIFRKQDAEDIARMRR
jgi:hypothetical protein